MSEKTQLVQTGSAGFFVRTQAFRRHCMQWTGNEKEIRSLDPFGKSPKEEHKK